MPSATINGVQLYWELSGATGDPLVLVHGSWGDHHNWDRVVPELSKNFRVLTYDRRGHSKSERPKEQGNMEQDVSDLIALVEYLGLTPAHIVGNSGGAAVVLKTAIRKPELFHTMVVHEPPLFGVLKNIPEASHMVDAVNSRVAAVIAMIEKGDDAGAARQFVETIAFGTGGWELLPEAAKQTFIFNAPTFYDEIQDPYNVELDTSKLSSFHQPTLLTNGTKSPPFFPLVMEQIRKAMPEARSLVFEGEGHAPHISNPDRYIAVLKEFCRTAGQGQAIMPELQEPY